MVAWTPISSVLFFGSSFFSMAQVTEFRGPSDGIRENPHDNQHIIQRSNAAGHDIFLVIIVQKRPCVLQQLSFIERFHRFLQINRQFLQPHLSKILQRASHTLLTAPWNRQSIIHQDLCKHGPHGRHHKIHISTFSNTQNPRSSWKEDLVDLLVPRNFLQRQIPAETCFKSSIALVLAILDHNQYKDWNCPWENKLCRGPTGYLQAGCQKIFFCFLTFFLHSRLNILQFQLPGLVTCVCFYCCCCFILWKLGILFGIYQQRNFFMILSLFLPLSLSIRSMKSLKLIKTKSLWKLYNRKPGH